MAALQAQGQYAEASARYRELASELAAAWGGESPDLAPYVYNLGLALKLSGQTGECLAAAAEGTRRWPDSLQLRLLEATTRAELASAQEAFDPRANQAFEHLLQEEHFPRLRGMRVQPTDLFAQWGAMLVETQQAREALQVVRRGLQIDPRHRGCRELEARSLLSLGYSWEAIPILKDLSHQQSSPGVEFRLGVALVDAGRPKVAWRRLSKLLENRPPGYEIGTDWTGPGSVLTLKSAQALNEIGRYGEAAALLIQPSIWEPERPEVLLQLSTASRMLGADEAAEALIARSRDLAPCDDFRQHALSAGRVGQRPSEMYQLARVFFAADQVGAALDTLGDVIALAPRLWPAHLEQARVHTVLGRHGVAEQQLRGLLRDDAVPIVTAELARILVLRDRDDEARRLLDEAGLTRAALDDLEEDPAHSKRLAPALARAARVHMMLGDLVTAEALLSPEVLAEESFEEVELCRAEIAVRRGKADRAGRVLTQDFQPLPGGVAWARALRTVIALSPPPTSAAGDETAPAPELDPSDLLDHPRLVQYLLDDTTLSPPARRQLERVWTLHGRRMPLLESVTNAPDGEVAARWRELIALYLEFGAWKKARQVAWMLAFRDPYGVEENRWLLRALATPEEALQRLGAALRGLESAPDDRELRRAADQARTFLGMDAS
jgi:Flp pilus assembly protein TadD